MATPNPNRVIEIVTDGLVDGGRADDDDTAPETGVVTILVFKLCDSPATMRVRRRKPLFLKRGTKLWRRVEQSKIRAADHGDDGLVYVKDTEGDDPKKMIAEMAKGRDSKRVSFPMAIGVALPCIESWMMADANAIRSAMSLAASPNVPDNPEAIPDAPKKAPGDFYKQALAKLVGQPVCDISSEEKWAIIRAVNDCSAISGRCPRFAAFSEEVVGRIRPLFQTSTES